MQCEITDSLPTVLSAIEAAIQACPRMRVLIEKNGEQYRASMHDAPSEEPPV